jgi:multiple sugar transport system substrate-binding protein
VPTCGFAKPAPFGDPRSACHGRGICPNPHPRLLPRRQPHRPPTRNPPHATPRVTPNPSLTLWVNETSPAHRAAMDELAQDFLAQTGINLEVVLVDERRLPELVDTAVLSQTLPDLILHPLEYSPGWATDGILNAEAATAVLAQLGRDTFAPGALGLVTLPGDASQITAVPSDGWQQIWLYRTDWFDLVGQEPPLSYQAILSGTAAIYRNPDIAAQSGISQTLISGLVVPTEAKLISTQQVFEQLALANGCELIDEKGEILFTQPACYDALRFYRQLVNSYSPSDVQTDITALNAYLGGRTGLIVTSPSTLPKLAGLDESYLPTCPACATNPTYLAENSGIITAVTGQSNQAQPATFSDLTALGITNTADPALAEQFLHYWFNDGYLTWLATEPERKVPLRRGTAADPTQFVTAWQELPSNIALAEVYGADLLASLAEEVSETNRWGLGTDQGNFITAVRRKMIFPILLQEMLSGYFTSDQAISEAYGRLVDLIPDYAYYKEPSPP